MTLTLILKNIGPYQQAEIPITPLTILTGPEHSDYLYLLRFIHTLYRLHESYGTNIPDLKRAPKVKQYPDKNVVDLVATTALREVYERNLVNRLESYLGVETSDLRRSKTRAAEIILKSKTAGAYLKTNESGELKFCESECPFPLELFAKGPKKLPRPGTSTTAFSSLISGAIGIWVITISEGNLPHSLYLPTNRGEITNVYDQELDPAQNAPIVNELLEEFDGCSFRNDHYDSETWKEDENNLIRTSSHLIIDPEGRYEIVVRTGDRDIPPNETSPDVSSLIPIFLSLKYRHIPGEVFIIEQPEEHLTPDQQIHLARLFVRMVKSGYRVIIGTQSAIIIDEIMRLRAEYLNDPTNADSISPDDVTLCIENKMEWGRGLFPVELKKW
ncbi:AAA family ATPase [Methanospirillum lacunae]|uniref:Uncharacterized protein n=1 Tax=Methanospirillum lacunae TaxID=668570 RepID=A0A2V2N9L8_9EURY|nr:AAA family ATPase [Methanospirillum lacunae]PWR74336.1 hypothetical protein DK846_04090 [Methanospirillum lacunae]